ncbi:MAG: energy-coupling factor ABC transporter permease [Gemmataceae bacterium]|nr:energy-coupling factor ABC transporter permease [Gemmataceae bacterium]MDW8267314.1 energy-coupling factor ABC transporter permease [Gemmataceae bacterium]
MHLKAVSLWGVHIADGVLTTPWYVGGFLLAGVLLLVGCWRLGDEEVSWVALLTAAFFVASQIHVRVGPTSVHLLLNGLLGVVLGRRALLAIPVGLFLQMALFQHGGLYSLGVNAAVQAIPALIGWRLFRALHRAAWYRHRWGRIVLVTASGWLWLACLVYSLALLWQQHWARLSPFFHAAALIGPLLAALALAAWEHRLEASPEFPLGLLVGVVVVLATITLHSWVLLANGETLQTDDELVRLAEYLRLPVGPATTNDAATAWQTLALLVLIAHIPLAAVEGVILGFTVSFLARVRPELLGGSGAEKRTCSTEA